MYVIGPICTIPKYSCTKMVVSTLARDQHVVNCSWLFFFLNAKHFQHLWNNGNAFIDLPFHYLFLFSWRSATANQVLLYSDLKWRKVFVPKTKKVNTSLLQSGDWTSFLKCSCPRMFQTKRKTHFNLDIVLLTVEIASVFYLRVWY